MKTYFSASTDRMIAYACHFLESSFQCGSNESDPISLQHSVQVLPTDESGHVYRESNFDFIYFCLLEYFFGLFSGWLTFGWAKFQEIFSSPKCWAYYWDEFSKLKIRLIT